MKCIARRRANFHQPPANPGGECRLQFYSYTSQYNRKVTIENMRASRLISFWTNGFYFVPTCSVDIYFAVSYLTIKGHWPWTYHAENQNTVWSGRFPHVELWFPGIRRLLVQIFIFPQDPVYQVKWLFLTSVQYTIHFIFLRAAKDKTDKRRWYFRWDHENAKIDGPKP